MKQTIAQRKVGEKTNGRKKRGTLYGLLACIPFGAVAYVCKYVLPGYSFTFLVCLAAIALILFYTFLPVVGIKFPGFARTTGGIVTTCLILGLLAAGVTEFFILRASEGTVQPEAKYLVVLGAKVRPHGPSPSLQDRIDEAFVFLTAHPDVTAVLSGGQGADEVESEAACMFRELTNMGISANRLLLEDKSTNTKENITFSLNVIREQTGDSPEKLTILSSEYHMLRASMVAKSCGVEFEGVPAKTTIVTQLINHLMREVPAVWKYAILGGASND